MESLILVSVSVSTSAHTQWGRKAETCLPIPSNFPTFHRVRVSDFWHEREDTARPIFSAIVATLATTLATTLAATIAPTLATAPSNEGGRSIRIGIVGVVPAQFWRKPLKTRAVGTVVLFRAPLTCGIAVAAAVVGRRREGCEGWCDSCESKIARVAATDEQPSQQLLRPPAGFPSFHTSPRGLA